MSCDKRTEILAFYLPQFHPIPENDHWWGEGFTEWRNVVRASPRFSGHRQPKLPGAFGFYDLRMPEVMGRQFELARRYGISGFCVYHYWFMGKELLETPLNNLLARPEIPFRYILCWANETWTRAWDGRERDMLIKQDYAEEDDAKHIATLMRHVRDERYIKIDGRPVFSLYRPSSHPDMPGFRRQFDAALAAEGFGPVLLLGCHTGFDTRVRCEDVDGVIRFQPNRADLPEPRGVTQKSIEAARRLLPDAAYQALKARGSAVKMVDYSAFVRGQLNWLGEGHISEMPCVFPNWDNTPRRRTPIVIQNTSATDFAVWVEAALRAASESAQPFVFVNAWNEWAEGCFLEPDLDQGYAYLEALKKGVDAVR